MKTKECMKGTFVVLALSIFVASSSVWATVRHFPTGSGSPSYATIQAAINAAVPGDEIYIHAGTHTVSGQIVINKNSLWIYGDDPATTILKKAEDTGNPGSGNARAWFLVTADVTTYLEFSHVTLDGVGRNIAIGILSFGQQLSVHDCVIKNIGWQGGGPPHYYGRGACVYAGVDNIFERTVFENIGRIGVFTFYSGVNTVINNSTYIGKGVGDWLDYAFESGGGAELAAYCNSISGCRGVASSDGSTSAGLLGTTYFGAGTVLAAEWNIITDCTQAVAIGYDASDSTLGVVRSNNLAGNSLAIVNSNPVNIVYAPLNWYGTYLTDEVIAQVSGIGSGVDYSPWLHSGNDVDAGDDPCFTPDRSELWVDNDRPLFYPALNIIQEGIDLAASGGTVHVASGTYNETNINVTKPLTITGKVGDCPGPAPDAPIVDGGGANADGFIIAPGADNVTIEGLFIRKFGISPTSAGVGVGIKAYGTSTDPTTNITVRSNQFDNNIWANAFFYNEGQSLFDDIDINCNVVNMGPWSSNTNVYGIECTNCINSNIAHNEVSGGYVGILMTAQAKAGTNVTAGGNSIKNNTVSDPEFAGMQIVPFSIGGPGPTLQNVSILDNLLTGDAWGIAIYQYSNGILKNFTISENEIRVKNPAADGRSVYVFDMGGTSTFSYNTVVLSGTSPPSYFHGLDLGGSATGNWTIKSNVFEGNSVGPNSVGIRLRGTLPATSTLDINCNRLEGWNDAIRSDALLNAALVKVYNNSLAGNATNGFRDGGSITAIDAENNWWGCIGGPGASGCDSVSGNVDYTPWATSVPPCVNCSDDADCDDGLACNGAETCILEVCQAGVPVDCTYLNDQCNTGICEEPAGTCKADPKPNGTICDDGDTCSIPDQCQGGVCITAGGGDTDDDGICDADDICPNDANNDIDGDTVCGDVDNCPAVANANQVDADGDGFGDVCDNCPINYNPGQEDNYPPGGNTVGDACECEGNFDCDTDVDSKDAATFKLYFGRGPMAFPCTSFNPCRGDFDCDRDVDSTDAARFKRDFGRSTLKNPCPPSPTCTEPAWCGYKH